MSDDAEKNKVLKVKKLEQNDKMQDSAKKLIIFQASLVNSIIVNNVRFYFISYDTKTALKSHFWPCMAHLRYA